MRAYSFNEREFDNGDQRIKTPLITVVAASNELPIGEKLNALYDRFLLHCQVTTTRDEGRSLGTAMPVDI